MIIIAGCIIGFDNKSPRADDYLIDFANRNDIPEMFINLFQVGPGTELHKRIEKEGRLLAGDYDEEIGNQTAMINFVPTRPASQIVEELIRLYKVLYQPSAYLERTYRHFRAMQGAPVRRRFVFPYPLELHTVGMTILRQGFLYSSRWQFWKQFFQALVHFPRRFPHYVSLFVMAEHYYEFMGTIESKLRAKLAVSDNVLTYHPPDSDDFCVFPPPSEVARDPALIGSGAA